MDGPDHSSNQRSAVAPDQHRPDERQPNRVVDFFGGGWVWIFVALFAVVALSVRFAVQPSTSSSTGDPDSTAAAPRTRPTLASTLPPTTVTPSTSTPRTTAAPADTGPLEDSGVWTMPDEIGNVLSSAKDDIEALAGGTPVAVAVRDTSGKGRRQIIHQHWQVCSQTPPAGSKFTPETGVTFGVVKTDETCPDKPA